MEKIFTESLYAHVNEEIISYFMVAQKELREGNKSKYIRLRLADSSGTVAANIWNNAAHFNKEFEEGDIVKIKGIVITYKDQVQVTVNKIRKADDNEYDLSEFIPKTKKDVNELSDQLFGYIDSIDDEPLRTLLTNIFEDKDIYALFMRSPAAKSWHHNYMGGLLEHTVSVAKICDFSAKMYPVQRDLLITGAILHDIGKIYEYNMKTAIDFTTMGRLIGHIPLGDQLITETAAKINLFPKNTLMKLRHLILAHHGEYEKASCRLPQTIEAVVLHFADNLDAQTIGVRQLVEVAEKTDAEWTEYDRMNNRY